MEKVQFINQTIGYTVGGSGTFLKTIDGGENWSSIITGETSYLISLSCINENTIYIGSSDIFKKSTNGGITFNEVTTYPYFFASSIQFVNELTGFVATGDSLYKTNDGGSKHLV